MKGLSRAWACRLSLTCLLSGAALGCQSRTRPVSGAVGPDRPQSPSTAPSDGPRTDGIYECRGIETPTSSGGWPFFHLPSTPARIAHFVRFYPDGHVRYVTNREPWSTAEAVKYLDGLRRTGDDPTQPYAVEGPNVRFTFDGPVVVYGEGTLRGDNLALRWWSDDVPPEVNVFRFVKWP